MLARFCKGAKLEVKVEISLIQQDCEDITSLNIVVFTQIEAENVQANLLVAENAINVKTTEDLLYFAFDD